MYDINEAYLTISLEHWVHFWRHCNELVAKGILLEKIRISIHEYVSFIFYMQPFRKETGMAQNIHATVIAFNQ